MTHLPVSVGTLVSCTLLLATAVATSAQTVIRVDSTATGAGDGTTWVDAFSNLQDALDAVVPPAQIWVARGTYVPDQGAAQTPGDRSSTFNLRSDVGLFGGFLGLTHSMGRETSLQQRNWQAHVTVLSGDLSGDDGSGVEESNSENSFHVVTAGNTNAAAVLDGFTITGGNADGVFSSLEARGGGIYCVSAHPTIVNCLIRRNSGRFGGGMSNEQSNPTITNCTFDFNDALTYYSGAGIFNRFSNPTITDVSFVANTARAGAGIYNEWSDPIVTRCRFVENIAGWFGGGMWNIKSSPIVSECVFERNSAGRGGGGMESRVGGSPLVTDCTFDGNTADQGGGMSFSSSVATVKSCLFRGNTAEEGGAIYSGTSSIVNDSRVVTVTDCNFVGNLADYGGGIFNDSESATVVTGCEFLSNFGDWGGGIHNFQSAAEITNCTFSLNSVYFRGGGMSNDDGRPTVTNCTFAGNTSRDLGGGIYNFSGSKPTLINSILWGNSAKLGGDEIYNEDATSSFPASTALIGHSLIRGSGGSAQWDAAFGTDTGGNIDADPRFIRISKHGGGDDLSTLDVHEGPDDVFGDLRLQYGSPAIDAGDVAALPADASDLDGDGDTLEPIPFDIRGSSRVVDDPGVPNTGNGAVDMGAHELNPVDCNNNGMHDSVDIAFLIGFDCNGNGILDECEADCNANGVADSCDIGTIDVDCNINGVPDACEPDCDGNGVTDSCDIAAGATDADTNGIPDVCELRFVDALATGAGDGTSWVDAFTNLQDALSAAAQVVTVVPRQRIWVAAGSYSPDQGAQQTLGDRFATFQLIDRVELFGGFLGNAHPSGGETSRDERDWQANVTVLSGDLSGDDVSNLPDFFPCFGRIQNDQPFVEGCEVFDADGDGFVTDAEADMDDNSRHVVTGSDTDETAALDGFTITGGSASGGSVPGGIGPSAFNGGGMATVNGSPSVVNCRFTENIARFVGGGMTNEGINTRIAVTNCMFDRNFARFGGGMRSFNTSRTTVVGCIFRDNFAGELGGGMGDFRSASLTLQDCMFTGNRAGNGGALCVYGPTTIVRRCVFVGNVAQGYAGAVFNEVAGVGTTYLDTIFSGNIAGEGGGAMANYAGSPTIVNCSFSGNTSGLSGGAIMNRMVYPASVLSPVIINSTFSGNIAGEFGGAIVNRDESVTTLTNSILWGNSAALGSNEIHNDNTDPELPVGSAIVRFSDIAGSGGSQNWDSSLGMDEGGNIDGDPLFLRVPSDGGDGWGDDPSTPDVDESENDDFGDLRLGAGSPAIDAGDNNAVPPDILDIDNDGDIAEAIPSDLAGLPRFGDDSSVLDTGLPGNGHTFIVDMGAYEAQNPKNRFIAFVIPTFRSATDTAIRVELVSLLRPQDNPDALSFAGVEGELRYVNRIRDDNGNVVIDCPDSGSLGTSYPCATLGCQPEYADWSGLLGGRAIHVTADAIVPSSRYHVAFIPRICEGDEVGCPVASADLVVTTSVWGNVQGRGDPSITQVVLVVDKVKGLKGQLPEYHTMLQPETLRPYQRSTTVQDITTAVDALKGIAYPFDGPAGCP